MAFPLIPVLAGVAAYALVRSKGRRRAKRPTPKIVVVDGEKVEHEVEIELGDKLAIRFWEGEGEEWKMTDAPDGYLVGSAKIKWEPAPGERQLKYFSFVAKRQGSTKVEFVKYIEGGDPNGQDCAKIDILVERRLG